MSEPAPQPQKKSKSTPILIIIGGIIAALLVVVIILLFSILNKTPAENDTAQSSAQPSSSQSSSSSSSKPSSEPKLSKEEELAIALQEFKNAKTFEFDIKLIGHYPGEPTRRELHTGYKVDYSTNIIELNATYSRTGNIANEDHYLNYITNEGRRYYLDKTTVENCQQWAYMMLIWKDGAPTSDDALRNFRSLFKLNLKDATQKGEYFHFPNADGGIDILVKDGRIAQALINEETDHTTHYNLDITYDFKSYNTISLTKTDEMKNAVQNTKVSEACAKKK